MRLSHSRSPKSRWLASLATLSCVLLAATACQEPAPPVPDGRWGDWHEHTISLPRDSADVVFLDLLEGQRIELVFRLEPTSSVLSVSIGNVLKPNRPDWQWGFEEAEYSQVVNDYIAVFRASQTFAYAVWMKSVGGEAVTVRLQYRFSNWG